MKKIIIIFISMFFLTSMANALDLYHFNSKTKEYIRASVARQNPKEAGKHLIPSNSTILPPIECAENEVSIFKGLGWVKKIDRIGQHYYEQDGTKIIISDYDIDIPSGAIINDPPTKYHDSHDGVVWIENIALKDQELIFEEIQTLKSDLKTALVWQFRMIEALYEIGVGKGIWDGSDISDTELKQKYMEWKNKLVRLRELGE